MESRYRSKLTRDVRALLDRIEFETQHEVGVELNPDPSAPDSFNPEHLAVRVNEHSATILIRSDGVFPESGALHELLHIERFWLQGTPQLELDSPWTPGQSEIANALEHLVIVPRQRYYSCDDPSYWVDQMRNIWTSRWPALLTGRVDQDTIRIRAMLGWTTTVHLAPASDIVKTARDALRQSGHLTEAERFREAIVTALPRTERMAAVACDFFGIPLATCRLAYLNAIAGVRTEKRLSDL